jgi:hypothetical protein
VGTWLRTRPPPKASSRALATQIPRSRSTHSSRHDRARRWMWLPATDHQQWPDLAMHDAGSANARRQIRMFHVPAVMHLYIRTHGTVRMAEP